MFTSLAVAAAAATAPSGDGLVGVGETRPCAALGGLEKRYEPVAPDVLVALGRDGFLPLPLGLV